MVSVGCFPVAGTDYRMGRAAPSARRPFFETRLYAMWLFCGGFVSRGTSRHADGRMHSAHSGAAVVRRVQRPVSACTRTAAPFRSYSPKCLEGKFCEVRLQDRA